MIKSGNYFQIKLLSELYKTIKHRSWHKHLSCHPEFHPRMNNVCRHHSLSIDKHWGKEKDMVMRLATPVNCIVTHIEASKILPNCAFLHLMIFWSYWSWSIILSQPWREHWDQRKFWWKEKLTEKDKAPSPVPGPGLRTYVLKGWIL